MAKETLHVPEEDLGEVIDVIRAGLKATRVSNDVWVALNKWCDDEEEYLERLQED